MNNFKEYEIDDKLCIGGWYIPEDICDKMIEFYHTNKHLHTSGKQYDAVKKEHVNLDVKESTDIHIYPGNNVFPLNLYSDALDSCLKKYIQKYEIVNTLPRFNITEHFNIQHYGKGGGFKKWHFESGNHNEMYIRRRILVFMTYLNDVDDGGTEFKHQKLITPAKKGLTLIWPVWWTHTHRGQVSHTKEKYIVTGWLSEIENENG